MTNVLDSLPIDTTTTTLCCGNQHQKRKRTHVAAIQLFKSHPNVTTSGSLNPSLSCPDKSSAGPTPPAEAAAAVPYEIPHHQGNPT